MSYRITLTANARGERGVRVDDPVWPHVEQRLNEAYYSGGGVRLSLEKEPEQGIGSLEFRADPGRFLLMAILFEDVGDRAVCWRQGEGTPERGMVDIGGDEWDARWVVTDLSIALRVFKEVFDTGELSADLLQHMR